MYTNLGLAAFVKECLALPTKYLWDGFGSKNEQGQYCFDCSGLIKCYYMGGLKQFYYDEKRDLQSYEMIEKAERKGPVSEIPEIEGLGVYLPGHIGVYVTNGTVIECTSNPRFGDGVVETNLNDRKWEQWLEIPYILYLK
ncbi:MAG: NlpC/P60 family protein [Lachnospiraceae bacterium]|nr:NlpC/P60 family protein [Lachnospiraceae bacterium]